MLLFQLAPHVTFFLNAVVLLFQYYPRLSISRTIAMVLSQDDLRVKLFTLLALCCFATLLFQDLQYEHFPLVFQFAAVLT